MKSWRGSIFNSCVAILPLALLMFFTRRSNTISLAWLAAFGLGYAWLLKTVVVPFFFDPLSYVPYPPGDAFFLGHFKALYDKRRGDTFLHWILTVPNDGLIHFRSIFHMKSRLILTTPEVLQDVLTTHPYDFEKEHRARRFLTRLIGSGLVVAEGKEHKMQRKSVTPAFHGKVIRDLVPTFWKKASDFTDAISSELTGERDPVTGGKTGVVEINALASRITLDIIGLAGLGRDFNSLVDFGDELPQQYELMFNSKRVNVALLFAAQMILPTRILNALPWKANRRVLRAAKNLRRICGNLVQEKKRAVAEKPTQQIDILSVLIKSGMFDDTGYVDQLLTFLAAGHETTSSALTWAVWLLSINPNVQDRLRAEVLEHIPMTSSADDLDATVLDSMEYLAAVCNEVLRLYPTVPNTAREAIRDTTVGRHKIPKGALFVISPWALNRNPQTWGEDADKFNPDRWLDKENPAKVNPYNFLTFIHGPRSCIGQGFARTELKSLLAAILRRFHLEMANPDQEVVPSGAVTIKPYGGITLRLREISHRD